MDGTATTPSDSSPSQPGFIVRFFRGIGMVLFHIPFQRYQVLLDKSVPKPVLRWVISAVLLIIYVLRVFLLQGWYIVTYALGIYHLNLFIAFLSPKIDPALTDDGVEDGPSLPTKSNEEFRPFIRRLPEFKFWLSATKAIVVAMFCTFFEIFDVPVFWPILVMYFIILFSLTMKRQIKHMVKYRYLPWSQGKTKYRGKEDTGDVIR
ncbi:protein RER1-like isoform X1 [Asterias rubens]|uniref:protein RER1-like isoform X1 n=1 Tax=Asterias rubens TaxID=7604 RepID=UPI001455660B|nr:protein RER1-like isoform X1 [Asterias rubens]XP_033642490.1 protein RER1-like isoform X1 [Asterias rubens]